MYNMANSGIWFKTNLFPLKLTFDNNIRVNTPNYEKVLHINGNLGLPSAHR